MSKTLGFTKAELENPGDEIMSLSFLNDDYHETARSLRTLHRHGYLAFTADMDNSLGDASNGWVPGEHEPKPDKELGAIMSRMNEQNDGRTMIITGRPKKFVESVLPKLGIFTAAEQGSLIFTPSGEEMSRQAIVCRDQIYAALEKLVKKYPGARVEKFKSASATVEFTQIPNAITLAPHITEEIMELVKELDPDQAIEVKNIAKPDNCCVEIVPGGVSKRIVLDTMTRRQAKFRNVTWAFVGDNNTDMPLMNKLMNNRKHDGFIIWVGDKLPKEYQDYRHSIHVEKPADTRKLMRYMIAG